MRVYFLMIFTILFSLLCPAVNVNDNDDDDQEVKLVGDKNYSNNENLIYDGIDVSNYQKDIDWRTTARDDNIKFVYNTAIVATLRMLAAMALRWEVITS